MRESSSPEATFDQFLDVVYDLWHLLRSCCYKVPLMSGPNECPYRVPLQSTPKYTLNEYPQ